jgi:hypothetical protein
MRISSFPKEFTILKVIIFTSGVLMKAFLLIALSVGLVACSGHKGGSSVAHSAGGDATSDEVSTLTDQLNQVTKITSSQAVSYEFTIGSCSTGERSYDSYDKLCIGLQNNTINKNCAIDLRKNFFKRYCQGTFSAFDDLKTDKTNLNIFDIKDLTADQSVFDVIKTSIANAKVVKTSEVIFSCADSLESAVDNSESVVLLGQSRIIARRETKTANPRLLINCHEKLAKESTLVKGEDYIERKISVGNALMEMPVLMPSKSEVKSELLYVSCSQNATDALLTGLNGISLTPGSKILIKRDLNGEVKNVIISCEQE